MNARLERLDEEMVDRMIEVHHFPFWVGRAAECQLVLDQSGVWNRHLSLVLEQGVGVFAKPHNEAFFAINGKSPTGKVQLRQGDTLELGGVKLRFWLAPMEQKNFALREVITWTVLALLAATQVGVVYWLIR